MNKCLANHFLYSLIKGMVVDLLEAASNKRDISNLKWLGLDISIFFALYGFFGKKEAKEHLDGVIRVASIKHPDVKLEVSRSPKIFCLEISIKIMVMDQKSTWKNYKEILVRNGFVYQHMS